MAIVEDYAAIAAELRRLRAGATAVVDDDAEPETEDGNPRHPMRRTRSGELLYKRLVTRRARMPVERR